MNSNIIQILKSNLLYDKNEKKYYYVRCTTIMSSVIVEVYSEKAIVVRNTLEHHGPIMEQLGGTFNEKLKGGRGWIFSKFKLSQVRNIIEKLNSGQYGNEYEQKSVSQPSSSSSSSPPSCNDYVLKTEFLSVLSRLERTEALISNLCKLLPSHMTSQSMSIQTVQQNKPVKGTSESIKNNTDAFDIPEEEEEEIVERKRMVTITRK